MALAFAYFLASKWSPDYVDIISKKLGRKKIKNPKGNKRFYSPDVKRKIRGKDKKKQPNKKIKLSHYHDYDIPEKELSKNGIFAKLMSRFR